MAVPAQLDLIVDVSGADPSEVDDATQQLRRELLALDVDDVSAPSGGPAPPGSRAPGAAEVGALVVTFLGTPGLLSATLATVREWLGRRPDRAIEVTLGGDTLKLSGASSAEQEQLVRAFLDRHR